MSLRKDQDSVMSATRLGAETFHPNFIEYVELDLSYIVCGHWKVVTKSNAALDLWCFTMGRPSTNLC